MEILKQKILEEGVIVSEHILNLDAILNHQVEPPLIMEMGKSFASRFKDEAITKVLTIESSGISVGFACAMEMNVPLVFARRKKMRTSGDQELYMERVPSFTKSIVTDIVVSKQFLHANDRILIIDDIIANGDAVRGLMKIIDRAGATLAGLGVVVEKTFQSGADSLRSQGIKVESLVRLDSLKDGQIKLS